MSPQEVFDMQVDAIEDLLDAAERMFPMQLNVRALIVMSFAERLTQGWEINRAAEAAMAEWELT